MFLTLRKQRTICIIFYLRRVSIFYPLYALHFICQMLNYIDNFYTVFLHTVHRQLLMAVKIREPIVLSVFFSIDFGKIYNIHTPNNDF